MTLISLEALAAMCGLSGSLLLAMNGRYAAFGWVAFLCSNAAWLAFAWQAGHGWLFAQQVGFTITSFTGIWVWLIRPAVQSTCE